MSRGIKLRDIGIFNIGIYDPSHITECKFTIKDPFSPYRKECSYTTTVHSSISCNRDRWDRLLIHHVRECADCNPKDVLLRYLEMRRDKYGRSSKLPKKYIPMYEKYEIIAKNRKKKLPVNLLKTYIFYSQEIEHFMKYENIFSIKETIRFLELIGRFDPFSFRNLQAEIFSVRQGCSQEIGRRTEEVVHALEMNNFYYFYDKTEEQLRSYINALIVHSV